MTMKIGYILLNVSVIAPILCIQKKRFAEKVRVKKAYRRAVYANGVTKNSVPVLAATN
jgi:hypothetical protein